MNKLPDGWKEVEMGNICQLKRGPFGSALRKEFFVEKSNNAYKVYGQQNAIRNNFVFGDQYISESKFKELEGFELKSGDIILSTIGTIGEIAIVPKNIEKGIINSMLMRFRLDLSMDPKYFCYLFKNHITRNLKDRSYGGAIKQIQSSKDIKKIKIFLPPIKIQNKIVETLEKAEQIKKNREEADKLTEKYLHSLFYDMFGSIQKNSKKFEIIKMNEIIDTLVDVGSNGSNATVAKNLIMSDQEDYAIMIRTVNFTANNFVDNIKYVSKEVYNFFSKSQIFGGEIIMNKIGSAGKIWLMPRLDKPVSLGLNQLAIRVKGIDPIYLFWYLETDYMKKKIQEQVGGAVTKSITKGAVRELEILLPPKALQKKFVSIIKKIETIKKQQNESEKEIDKIFDSLMSKAFKGELI